MNFLNERNFPWNKFITAQPVHLHRTIIPPQTLLEKE